MSVTDKSKVIVPKGFYGKANVLQGFNPETESIVDITTVRNTSGTIVNEAGNIETVPANVPRRDHANSKCGALLVEPQRTNLLQYSEDFNIDWSTVNGTITANTKISPDGTQSADTLTSDGGSVIADKSCIKKSNAIPANGVYSRSIFIKKGNTRYGWISSLGTSFTDTNGVIFDFDNEVITEIHNQNPPNTTLGASFKKYKNGWYRLTFVQNAFTSGVTDGFSVGMTKSPNTIQEHDAGDFIHIWGAQLEEGSIPTSYIPTTGAAATRNADEFNIDLNSQNVPEQYALLFDVDATGGRLLMESTGAGFDLDLKNAGRFAMLVDLNTITFKFPDNGQPQTELLVYSYGAHN